MCKGKGRGLAEVGRSRLSFEGDVQQVRHSFNRALGCQRQQWVLREESEATDDGEPAIPHLANDSQGKTD